MFTPTLQIERPDRNQIIYTDASVSWETIVWVYQNGLEAWQDVTSQQCWYIYKIVESGGVTTIQKPYELNTDTGKNEYILWPLSRDDRATYNYG